MALASGTRLGACEIVSAIGAGGMGEVYRAKDTKLAREVAIKVLPAELAQDSERLARFEREAMLLASLNHPNIAHVYGFESAQLEDGSTTHFLAMELVPGEDLAERLKRGPIPVDEDLEIAKQVAEAGGQLRKVASEGGRPLDLAAQHGAGGGAWLPGGEFVFAPMYSDGLFRVREGGAASRLTTPDRAAGELGHWWPCVLPGGDFVLFTGFRTPVDTSHVRAVSLATGAVHDVVEGGLFGRYVPGHLLYAKGGRLYAAPFDPARALVTGQARAVLEDVYTSQTGGYALFDVSGDGTLAYVPAAVADAPRELVQADRDGSVEPLVPETRRFVDLSLSPDDRTVALTIQGDSLDLWALELRRGTLSRVTAKPGTEFGPLWAPDGSALFFVVDRPPYEIHRIPFGSSTEPQALWKEPAELDTVVGGISPDGRMLAYRFTEPGTGANLWVRSIDGSDPPRSFRATAAAEQYPTFSPDGRWLAYESDETGRPEVYVEAFPGPGERHQVSADGGSEPLWARNGELFYRHDAEMRVVATRRGPGFEFGAATTVYSMAPYRGNEVDRTYDVTADGRRVVTIRSPEATAPRRIEIVTDWLSQLPRLLRGEP